MTLQREAGDGTYDVVLLLDVLEHVEDDRGFLVQSVLPHVSPSGRLVISVPAHGWLFSEHDRYLKHYRRYSTRQIRSLLTEVAEIEQDGGLFSSLLPVRAVAVVAERVRQPPPSTGVGAWRGGVYTTHAVEAALRMDAHVGRRLAERGLRVPALTYWAVVRTKDS